jgi:hypothetical protein
MIFSHADANCHAEALRSTWLACANGELLPSKSA